MSTRVAEVILRANVGQYRSAMRDAANATDQVQQRGERLSAVGRTMQRRLTVPLIALGAAAAVTGMKYQASMNRVAAVSSATERQFLGLSNQAKDLGATTQFSASQAADGMGFLAQAGFEATEILSAMPGVLDLAAAGQLDLAHAADLASNVLQAFNLDASEMGRVGDVLVATSIRANTSVSQLGEALKFAAPVASALGVSIEETAAAVGLMSDAGIQAGMAGTSLRMAMSRLADTTGPAADRLRDLGIEATNADGSLKPLHEIVRQLEESGADASDMLAIFGQRAGPGMLALVSQGSEALRELTEGASTAGEAARIAEVQMRGLRGALLELKSAGEAVGIAFFEAGIGDSLEGAARGGASFLRTIAATNPELLRYVTIIGGLAAASGPAVLAVGLLHRAYLPVIDAVAGVVRAKGQLVRFLAGPHGVALLGAIAVIQQIDRAWRDGMRTARELADEIRAAADTIDEANAQIAQSARDMFHELDEGTGALDRIIASIPGLNLLTSKLQDQVRGVATVFGLWRESSRDVGEGQEALEERIQAVNDTTGQYGRSVDAIARQLGGAGDAAGGARGQFADLGDEMEEAEDKAEQLRTSLAGLRSEMFDNERAALAYLDALEDLTEELDENDRTLDKNTKAGRDNREAIMRATEAGLAYIATLSNTSGSLQTATGRVESLRRQLIEHAVQSGLSRQAAQRYVDTLLGTPKEVRTALELDGFQRVMTLTDSWTAALGRVPRRVHTSVSVGVSGSIPSSARRLLAGAGISTRGHAGGLVTDSGIMPRMHRGGPVLRMHTGGLAHDEVSAVLQVGERVLSRRQNRLFEQHPMAREIVPRMHAGGTVGGRGTMTAGSVDLSDATIARLADRLADRVAVHPHQVRLEVDAVEVARANDKGERQLARGR